MIGSPAADSDSPRSPTEEEFAQMTDAEKDRWLAWDRERSEMQARHDKDDDDTAKLLTQGFQFIADRGEQSKSQQGL